MSAMARKSSAAKITRIAPASARRQSVIASALGAALDTNDRSSFRADDLVPELGILLLVGGPDLVLRHLAEGVDIGGVDDHALGLEQLFCFLRIVDAFRRLANLYLRLAREIEQQCLLILRQAVPDAEIDDRHGGSVIVIGHRTIFRN